MKRIRYDGMRLAWSWTAYLFGSILLGVWLFGECLPEPANQSTAARVMPYGVLAVSGILLFTGWQLHRKVPYSRLNATTRRLDLWDGRSIPLDSITVVYLTAWIMGGVGSSGALYRAKVVNLQIVIGPCPQLDKFLEKTREVGRERGVAVLKMPEATERRLRATLRLLERGAVITLAGDTSIGYARKVAQVIQGHTGVARLEFDIGEPRVFLSVAAPRR